MTNSHFFRDAYRSLPLPLTAKHSLRRIAARSATAWRHTRNPFPVPKRKLVPNVGNVGSRLLWIGPTTPRPDWDAGSQRSASLMKALAEQAMEVVFLPETDLAYDPYYTRELGQAGIVCAYYPTVKSVSSYLNAWGHSFDFIVLERAPVASAYLELCRRHAPNAAVIFDAQDLHFLRASRQAEHENSARLRQEAAALEELELTAIRRSDATIVVSTYERDLIASRSPAARCEVFPFLMKTEPLETPWAERDTIAFIGGFRHQPNEDAVLFFASEVWPLVAEELPGVSFAVIGGDPTPAIRGLQSDRVKIMGQVTDLKPVLARARMTVAPLRFGAGVKGKVATSLAYGVPCVATFTAIEGAELAPGKDILVADEPEDLAEHISHLFREETDWHNLSAHGVEFVKRTYGQDAIVPRLMTLLDELRAK